VLALTFVPTAYLIGIGQITAVVLFGLAAFLAAARANRPFLAGTAAALTAIKPHLLTVFALWLLLNAATRRFGRCVVLGGVVIGLGAVGLTTLVNPDVWSDYLRATTGADDANRFGLSNWMPPVIGGWLGVPSAADRRLVDAGCSVRSVAVRLGPASDSGVRRGGTGSRCPNPPGGPGRSRLAGSGESRLLGDDD
jgi:hypothetical protein